MSAKKPGEAKTRQNTGVGPLFLVVLLAFMGQMILNPILAPLSRELGLKEWHIGATISLAAVLFSLTATRWGRAASRYGVRRILVIAMLVGAGALAAFAAVAWAGMRNTLTGTGLVIGVLLTRGLIYGSAIAAVSPAAQTHVVTHTETEAQRVKGVGMLGAAQGFSSILGSVLGGALAALGGLMLPLTVMPLMMLAGIAALLLTFHPEEPGEKIASPAAISYFDPRVFSYLVTGFLMFLVFSALATIFGFLLQDSLKLAASQTAGLAAMCMAIMGVTMIVSQAVISSKLGWSAPQLLRRGLVIVLAGIVLFVWPVHLGVFIVGSILVGLGMGLALPGYSVGPTLKMATHEQGGLAGLINANNGAAYVVAPIASTALYGLNPLAPIICGIVGIAGAVLLCYTHPVLRS